MNARSMLRALGVALIIGGAMLLGLAILNEEASVALIFIIPVIYGVGPLAAAAVLLVFIGISLVMLSVTLRMANEQGSDAEPSKKREFGGVVLIGPVPIVFGSARTFRWTWALAALSLVVLLLFLFILLR
jgi:uncharacterized protein (TIGR00304 family)